MPQLIGDLMDSNTYDSTHKNHTSTQYFLEQNPEPFRIPYYQTMAGYQLLKADKVNSNPKEESFELRLIFNGSHNRPQETVYVVEVLCRKKYNHILNEKNCSQVKVWRSRKSEFRGTVTGFAQKVFTYLLEQHSIVVTDDQHTRDGQNFWIERMSDAFEEPNTQVYFINLDSQVTPDTYPKIHTIENYDVLLEKFKGEGWGKDDTYRQRLFIISKKSLN